MSRLHYRHRVRGSTYEEVGEGTLQKSTPRALADGDTMRVYRSLDDGSLWVRETHEFDDGRFERVPYKPPETRTMQRACALWAELTRETCLAGTMLAEDDFTDVICRIEAVLAEGINS